MKRQWLPLLGLACGSVLLYACGGSSAPPPPPAAVTQLSVSSAVGTVTAGKALQFTVTALSASGVVVPSYAGTVHLASSDPQASFQPSSATLTKGTGTFSVIFKTAGSQSITATDPASALLTGGISVGVTPATAASLSVTAPAAASAGLPTTVGVNALDAYGNVATSYTGTVQVTSNDPQATIQPSSSLLPSGMGTFSVTFKTISSQSVITATDKAASVTGKSGAINVVSNTATHLSVSGPGSANARATFNFSVSALDAANNVSVNYSGTVHFTSSDGQAKLPADSTLMAGTSSFSAALETAGTQTLTATDVSSASINGASSISVSATPALAINSNAPPTGTLGGGYNPHTVSVCLQWSPDPSRYCLRWGTVVRFGFLLTATGGIPTYTWSATGLPPGLSLSARGNLAGTPTATGSYQVTVTATDSGLPVVQTSANYTITINNPPPPVVNTTPPAPAVQNQPYSYTFTANGYPPLTWSESAALPTGLVFSDNTGTLSGTPTQTGSFPITVTATDQFKQSSAVADFTIVVTAHGFIATGSMATARRFHTATLLGNGKVLVAGGEDGGSTAFASAELYDPTSGTFSPTGSMTVPRVGHSATLLSNGKVLITGGTSNSTEVAVTSAELYDPAMGTFAAATGSMQSTRASHTATLLKDGRVLVAGGDDLFFNGVQNANLRSLATAEIFDPNTESFAATGSMSAARESHTATLLSDGKVLIAGGSDGPLGNNSPVATVYSSAELFDPATGQFTAAGSMTAARDYFTATLLSTGRVLVAGGANVTESLATADLFDPASDSFTVTGNLPASRFYQDATLLKDGTVLLTGGIGASPALATAEVYDPTAGTFAITGSMISPRVWHTATLLQDGRVLVTGGAAPIATAELYQ
jgi:hypothetical protein